MSREIPAVLLLLALCLVPLLPAQEAGQEDPYVAGPKAYREKNYPEYLRHVLTLRDRMPANTYVLSRLAAAYALNGKTQDATKTLEAIASMGGSVDLSGPDYKNLANAPDLHRIKAAFVKNSRPRNVATVAFRLPEKDLIPEGMAFDTETGHFFLGSIHKNKILRIAKEGGYQELTGSIQNGIREPLGMHVDPKRRLLWVCASLQDAERADALGSALYQLELPSGSLIRRYEGRSLPGKRLFNDVAILPSGDVLFTDSEGGSVLKVSPRGPGPETVIADRTFIYPNGIALSADAKLAFIADQKGIHRYDIQSGKLALVRHPADISVTGIDGLYWYRDSLIGVQNGFEPARVIRAWLDKDRTSITRLEVLESNHPLFDIPTTGTVAGDRFFFIANSQLTARNQKGEITAPEKLKETIILVLQL